MKMNSIKWNREMAERCFRRASQSKDAKAEYESTEYENMEYASTERKASEPAEGDHWDEFRKAMDQLLKG